MIDREPLGVAVDALRFGKTTPLDYLDRLRDRIDRHEDEVRAFVSEPEWERLEREARVLPERFPDPESRPPLYGIPVGVKDIFHVEGMETHAGSELPPDVLTGPEAASVSRVREAGALVLGKTVTTEFAYFDPGPTRNPHDPDHTPGGSSSGSAAAVAAGYCPLALGTQTIGSVNRPAAFCGVVGVKPSYGRVSTDGVVPVAPSVDTVGWFTQDVAGARLAGGILCSDWRAEDRPGRSPRVGAVTGPYLEQAEEPGRAHFEDRVAALADAGLHVERIDPFADLEELNRRHKRLVAAETALAHADWYPEFGDTYSRTLTDLIEEGRTVPTEELANARAGRRALRSRLHEQMDDRGLDVLVSPAAPGPAPAGLDSTGDPIMNLPWTHAGVPTVTLPAGRSAHGLPMGVQCTARFGHDEWLLAWCGELEPALTPSQE